MRPDAPRLSTGHDEDSAGHELRRCRQPVSVGNGLRTGVPLQTAMGHPHLSALAAGSTQAHEFLRPDDCRNLYVRAVLSSEGPTGRNTAAQKEAGWRTNPRERVS